VTAAFAAGSTATIDTLRRSFWREQKKSAAMKLIFSTVQPSAARADAASSSAARKFEPGARME
jgi:hypothetical protein